MKRWTVKRIEHIPVPERGQKVYTEGNGLYLKVYPSGNKVFYYLYYLAGKQRWLRLGGFPDLSLADARSRRDELAAQVARGKDPFEEQRKARETEQKALTIAELADEFIQKWCMRRRKNWREDERILGKDVVPKWGKRKAKSISRRDVLLLLEDIGERGQVMANRTRSLLHLMFRFGVEREAIPHNPVEGVRRLYNEKSRDRHLSSEEISTFWYALDSEGAKVSREVKKALRLILATGARSGEVVGMRWVEIADNWWNLPAERTKSRNAHRFYLNPVACKLIGEPIGGQDYVFPSPKEGQHLTSRALSRVLRRNNHFGLEPFSPHDLRRSVATHMGKLGVPRFIVGQVLGHTERGITGIYDRYDYDAEKKQAMMKWSRHLDNIILGEDSSKIVKLK